MSLIDEKCKTNLKNANGSYYMKNIMLIDNKASIEVERNKWNEKLDMKLKKRIKLTLY